MHVLQLNNICECLPFLIFEQKQTELDKTSKGKNVINELLETAQLKVTNNYNNQKNLIV